MLDAEGIYRGPVFNIVNLNGLSGKLALQLREGKTFFQALFDIVKAIVILEFENDIVVSGLQHLLNCSKRFNGILLRDKENRRR